MRFLYKPIKRNTYSRKGNSIQYLVIHDTGNPNRGAGALAHRNYVENNTRGASAHYFVDDKVIVQYVGDSKAAGAVGDGKGKYGITNANSLSIEMCINSDADYAKTYKNTVELTKNLMKKFNIQIDRVVRHYDASRKNCPGHMSKNNWKAWWQFKENIQKPIEWEIDLSKDSEFGKNLIADKKEEKKEKVVDALQDEFKKAIEMGITDSSRPKDPASRQEVACMVLRGIRISNGEKLPNLGDLRSDELT